MKQEQLFLTFYVSRLTNEKQSERKLLAHYIVYQTQFSDKRKGLVYKIAANYFFILNFAVQNHIFMKNLFDAYSLKTLVRLFAVISFLFFLVNYFS